MSLFSHIPDILRASQSRLGDHPALCAKKEGKWVPISYTTLYQLVHNFAYELVKLGIQSEDCVGILSHNRPEWAISDLGILTVGAVSVPIYPTLSGPETAHIINDSQIVALIIESEDHLDLIQSIKTECPTLKWIIMIDPASPETDNGILSFSDLTESRDPKPKLSAKPPTRDSLASIVYTSGTTGRSKGVMLTHGNFLSNIEDTLDAIPFSETDSVLSFLPLSHVFERTAGYYTLLAGGGTIYYAQSIETVSADLLEVRPTVVIGVPRFFEKIQEKINSQLTGLKKVLFNSALTLNHQKKNGPPLGLIQRMALRVLHKLVIEKISRKTGGNIRFLVSGGAPLNPALAQYFDNLDLTIIQGYGLTEAAPIITCNRLTHNKLDSVGLPLKSVQIRLGDQNELQATGPNMMKGYLNLPDVTAATFTNDGWLKTGDIAEIDTDGFVRIVGRLKELIVLSNGKNISPSRVERLLTQSPYVSQAVAIGNNRNYLTALIVPDFDHLKQKDISETNAIMTFMTSEIEKAQRDLSQYEKVKKFALLQSELTQENGELTPTLKLKRKVIDKKYEPQIDKLYA